MKTLPSLLAVALSVSACDKKPNLDITQLCPQQSDLVATVQGDEYVLQPTSTPNVGSYRATLQQGADEPTINFYADVEGSTARTYTISNADVLGESVLYRQNDCWEGRQ